MPLTVRTNGSTNIVSASWWNDYHDLLTGVMDDQEVTIQNNLVLMGLGGQPTSGPSGSAVSGGSMSVGLYGYGYSYVSPDGESPLSLNPPGISTTSGNRQIQLNSIGTGPTGTTARNIYRTTVGGGTAYKLLTTLNDNTTTTYLDNNADSALGRSFTNRNTLGGSLVVKDVNGNQVARITNDGLGIFNGVYMPIGSLQEINMIVGVGTGNVSNYPHGLSGQVDWAAVTNAGNFSSPPAAPAYVGSDGTNAQINAQNGITFWAILIRKVKSI